jgi:oxygen-independent coproporphyrinogen III oxidase
MTGIYLHIPFCKQACHYCDFHFSTSQRGRDELLDAMLNELKMRATELHGQEVSTIYFGGGTPSLLSYDELMRLFEEMYNLFVVDARAEITIEANPDDLTKAYLKALKQSPINRLSVGVQSFRAEDLKAMNRAHSKEQALSCIPQAAEFGFDNISIDLIFGWPKLEMNDWMNNVEIAFSLPITHLSCYGLTVESKTALSWQIIKGLTLAPDEEKAAQQYEYLLSESERLGFPWYEISNFSKSGFESKHNRSYWQGTPYLGVGPSAHSYNGEVRSWNVKSNGAYVAALQRGEREYEDEVLSHKAKFHEFILTSLRMRKGICLVSLRLNYGDAVTGQLLESSQQFIEKNWLIREGDQLRLSTNGLLFADKITSELFVI